MQTPESLLQAELHETCDTASRAGYNPTYFRRMLAELGAVGAVRHLLATGERQAQTSFCSTQFTWSASLLAREFARLSCVNVTSMTVDAAGAHKTRKAPRPEPGRPSSFVNPRITG